MKLQLTKEEVGMLLTTLRNARSEVRQKMEHDKSTRKDINLLSLLSRLCHLIQEKELIITTIDHD